jgi:DNA-binding NarL/FixJ family response regulator
MRVLIVDDHPLFIKGVEALLFELDPTMVATGARTIEEAVDVASHSQFDLVLLDLKLPGTRDLDALILMRRALQATPIVVVSASDNPEYIWKAIELGAAGYIPKDTEQPLMIHALRVVLAHGVYLPPHALRSEVVPVGAPTPVSTGAAPALSDRQISVLQRLLQGKSNKVIARDLMIAEGTVKAHLWSIYQALGVSSRLQAMAKAHELRLVDRFAAINQTQDAMQ